MKISAALIVKNEEESLPACLESLRGVVDEIVVVDTGSEDKTVEIARSFTDRLAHFAWIDDFSAARNFSLDQATGDYILMIDADNAIVSRHEARALLDAFTKRHGAAVVGTVEITSAFGVGPDARVAVERAQRLFKRGRFRYTGAIHEQLVPVSGEPRAAATGVRYRHSGYAHDPASARHKSRRNRPMLLKELAKNPDDEYLLYQLGKAHFAVNEYGEAVAAFERCLACIRFEKGQAPVGTSGTRVAPVALSDLVVSLAYCYVNTGQVEKARDLLENHKALGHVGTHSADFHHALGYVYLMLGDIARSREAYLESLRVGVPGECVLGTGSYSSYYHLGLLSEAEQDLPGAVGHYLRSLTIRPDYRVALARCIDLIVECRIALPAEIWSACDHEAFSEAYLEKLRGFLDQGNTEHTDLLTQAAEALSDDLLARCTALVRDGSSGEMTQ